MSRIAYAAMLENGGNQMIVNGVKGKKYDFICEYQFSPNSKTLVHTAEEGDEAFVVINGREGPRYGAVLHVVISPDSKRVAYTTRGPNGLVVDGRWFGPYRFVEFESMVFSPDSKHFVYAADSADEKNACRLYLDGKEIDRCEELHLFSVRFTPDSGSLAYVYQKGGEWFVRFGATRYGPFEDADGVKMTISNDSKRSAFGVQHGKDWFLLCGDKKFGPYAWSPTPLFSPDSKHLAHVGGPRNKATVFLDGKPLGVYSGVGAWSFTPDSRHLAWIAEDGKKSTLVIDGAHAGDDVVEFQFSPDGKRLARIIRVKDIEYVEEAGQRGKAYKHVRSVSFSPDSRHLAYWASRGNDAVLVVDGLETFRFEGEILSSGFRANGTICGAGVMAPSGDENKFAQPANVKELKSVFEKRRLFLFEMAEAD
ncbi:MAG: WD40 repeat domain-containing protein [Thermoguttaceae bacterium]